MKHTVLAALPWIVLVHVLLFLFFWLTNSLFYSDVNDYITNLLGIRCDFVSLCLFISGIIGVWTIAQFFIHQPRAMTLSYDLVAFIYLIFFYASFWYLFRQSPIQLPRLVQMLVYFRLLLDPVILIAVTCLAALWSARHLNGAKSMGGGLSLSVIAPAIALCALIWLVLLLYPPGSVYAGALPAKPRVIAHRGASMLAPENTLAAMERAAQLGTYGVETDLNPSREGVPFLMHDSTLKRTTNVAAVFPGREKKTTEEFTIAEIKQLNAGEWFVNNDPYHTIAGGAVPAAALDEYKRQAVPTLAEELDLVRRHHVIFIFDLKEDPKQSTGAASSGPSFFDIVFRDIHAAGIDSQVWFLVDRAQLPVIRTQAPAMHPTYGADYRQPPDAAEIKTQGYEIVNAEYGLSSDWIKRYQALGLWVNLYTIDEPWQYSRLWLLGVDSTTSSNAQALLALDQPLLSLPYSQYLLLWIVVGLLCLGLLFGLSLRSP